MLPQNLVNLNLTVDGLGYAGVVMGLTLPKLAIKTEEHRAGGMDAPIDVDMGMEKLESAFTLSGWKSDVKKFFGLSDGSALAAVFRGAYRDDAGTVQAVVISMRGMLKENDSGDWKPGEKAEDKFTLACRYYKAEVDGQVIHEIDKLNGIRTVNGVDQMAAIRAAIGL